MCAPLIAEAATVRIAVSKGCVCRPDDREQALCAQHYINCEPLEGCEILECIHWFGKRGYCEMCGVEEPKHDGKQGFSPDK